MDTGMLAPRSGEKAELKPIVVFVIYYCSLYLIYCIYLSLSHAIAFFVLQAAPPIGELKYMMCTILQFSSHYFQ